MKISELQEYLKDYPRTTVNGASLGCHEVIIRTSTLDRGFEGEVICEPKEIVETHFRQIKEFIKSHGEYIAIYVRSGPELRATLDEEGEDSGQYTIRTRIQFGVKGKCITQEQFDHLQSFEANR